MGLFSHDQLPDQGKNILNKLEVKPIQALEGRNWASCGSFCILADSRRIPAGQFEREGGIGTGQPLLPQIEPIQRCLVMSQSPQKLNRGSLSNSLKLSARAKKAIIINRRINKQTAHIGLTTQELIIIIIQNSQLNIRKS